MEEIYLDFEFIKELKFDEKGLIPAIAQDAVSGEVLMCAYMNEESIKKTLETGLATYFSRSRQELWTKGETSGHTQSVVQMRIDCDADAIVLLVRQKGAACHTNNRSCFFRKIEDGVPVRDTAVPKFGKNVLKQEYATILDRVKNPVEGSYTNFLFEKGLDKMLKKVGEEASEVIIAAKNREPDEVKYETADLLFHLAVVLAEQGITWDDIFGEIESRRN